MRYFVLLLVLLSCGSLTEPVVPVDSGSTAINAQLIVTLQEQLVQLDLPSQQQTVLTTLAAGETARLPALAPDGRQIAFVLQGLPPEPQPGQSFVVPTANLAVLVPGAATHTIVYDPPEPLASITSAAWSPDGTTIYATLEEIDLSDDGVFLGYLYTILEIDVATGQAQRLIENAKDAAASPDGSQLVFVRPSYTELPQLMIYQAGKERVVIADQQLTLIEAPRWPTAEHIYFVAATDFVQPGGLAPSWLQAGTASAHGGEWYPWRINPDGTELVRYPVLQALEDPRIAFSDDSMFLWSFPGLWLYASTDPASLPQQVFTPGDVGGLTVLP